jgi:hypothetical protein
MLILYETRVVTLVEKFPTDYVPYIFIQNSNEKIPFIQQESFKPISRIPVAYEFSDTLSYDNNVYTFVILAHQSCVLLFSIDCLNGLYSEKSYSNSFKNSINLLFINSTTRNQDYSFLATLSRLSSQDFDQPANINIHSLLPNSASEYQNYKGSLVSEVSASFLHTNMQFFSDFLSTNRGQSMKYAKI